ncbi:MAG: hypothetical protein EOO09_17190 [Chitinophagaceae bacterium]|nr:MAG: hypothetical protein EOO09_17190 [Chitinophagaceae bacterium]
MYRKILFIMACILPSLLYAQLVNYNSNGKVRILSSFLVLEIDTTVVEIRGPEQSAGLLGSLMPPGLDLGAAMIGEAIKHGPSKYSSITSATASAAGFWRNDREVSLPVLKIRRMVIRSGKDEPEEAYSIRLRPLLSADRTAFRYVLQDSLFYKYAAVKTRRQYDFVNMEISVRLKALAVTNGGYELYDMRTSTVYLPMMKAGSVYRLSGVNTAGGWFPFPPRPSYEVETEEADEVSKTVATRGTSNGKPDKATMRSRLKWWRSTLIAAARLSVRKWRTHHWNPWRKY